MAERPDADARAASLPTPHLAPARRTSSSASWTAAPATSTRSTPSRCSRSTRASRSASGAVTKQSQIDAPGRVWLGSPWEFKQRGKSGLWVSDLFPHIATVADELCVVRSMVGELPLHGQQNLLLHTGRITGRRRASARGCRTAWARRTSNLPGYVVLNNDWVPNGGLENFASAFLPASHGATMMRAKGVPVDNIAPADPRRCSGASSPCSASRTPPSPQATAERDADRVGHRATTRPPSAMQAPVPRARRRQPARREATRQLYGLDSPNDYQQLLRPAVPAGPAAGRGGRAVRRDHLPAHARQQLAVGPARPAQEVPRGERPDHRPVRGGADHAT